MNQILQLKGRFEQKKNASRIGATSLPKESCVDVNQLEKFKNDFKEILSYWRKKNLIENVLVGVYYNEVIAKSNRVRGLLSKSGVDINSTIVGAKFREGYDSFYKKNKKKHTIVYCVSPNTIEKSIQNIDEVIKVLKEGFNGKITSEAVELINSKDNSKKIKYNYKNISKTKFINILFDACHVERFGVEEEKKDFSENAIVSIYRTGTDTIQLLRKLNINLNDARRMDENTFLFKPDQYNILKRDAACLISMSVDNVYDLGKMTKENFEKVDENKPEIPEPNNEPTIGVIDTLFDKGAYFSKWVKYESKIDPSIGCEKEDYIHGTMVSSIIVDGPTLNPELEDGCGRFKVRHFGVARNGQNSSFSIIRLIKEIVEENSDIKVWNLSLGSPLEINDNFISPEAGALDEIQYKNDVIFIVAGTNKSVNDKKSMKIGAPADSINSIVVNSVGCDNKPATYSREGTVLSFYNKPDISCFGGDEGNLFNKIIVWGLGTKVYEKGTSFAAPWISRKMAYLIHIMGFSREVAKALLINSATKWNKSQDVSYLVGYGVVPKRIEEIIESPEDEIRFILSGVSEKYDTYNYNIPVPSVKEKHPFVAKVLLCYFPKCTREQGVDYTNTELDVHFGRLYTKGIKSINNNNQANNHVNEQQNSLKEANVRRFYRKWDNVKYISEEFKTNSRPKKMYEKGMWGISIKTKERLKRRDGEGIKFAAIVSLKEINGVNRIENFIYQCNLKGWIVNKIDVKNRVEIYNKAEEEIIFE